MTLISDTDLPDVREKHSHQRIVCCTGTFDLTHAGHLLFFEDCKKYGDILVVSVANDAFIKSYKGPQRPILNQHVRLKMIDALKPVDYTVLDPNPEWHGEDSHQVTLGELFKGLRPHVYVVNHDALHIEERKRIAESYGVHLVVLDRSCPPEFESISASKIIEKIKSFPPQ